MSNNDEDTIELIEIDYYGKDYVVDNTTKEVYQKINDGYDVVGRLVSSNPVKIKFIKKPDWTEEYEDIEPMVYKGTEYMVNPKTRNVYRLNRELGDYEYVGMVIKMDPLEIYLELEDKQEDIEIEVIEYKGTKYIRDANGTVYDIKDFEMEFPNFKLSDFTESLRKTVQSYL